MTKQVNDLLSSKKYLDEWQPTNVVYANLFAGHHLKQKRSNKNVHRHPMRMALNLLLSSFFIAIFVSCPASFATDNE